MKRIMLIHRAHKVRWRECFKGLIYWGDNGLAIVNKTGADWPPPDIAQKFLKSHEELLKEYAKTREELVALDPPEDDLECFNYFRDMVSEGLLIEKDRHIRNFASLHRSLSDHIAENARTRK